MLDKAEFVSANELRLGDVIRLGGPNIPWTSAIVCEMSDTHFDLFRIYGTTPDFTYGGTGTGDAGRIICYIGTERVKHLPRDKTQWLLLDRKDYKQVRDYAKKD